MRKSFKAMAAVYASLLVVMMMEGAMNLKVKQKLKKYEIDDHDG